ncbi:MAG: O-antigen ligase family protein [Nitrospinota bacterium]|nr:O-antigen ligase family protein [Nitrospinota bacterium]
MERTIRILDRVIEVSLLVFVAFSLFSISITQISFTIGGLAWLARVQITRSWKQVKRPLGLVFLCFVIASILAVITAVEPENSFGTLKKLVQIIIFFWVVNSLKDEGQADLLVKVLIAAALAASLYGFYQALVAGVSTSSRVEGTMSIYMTFAGILMLVALMAAGRFLFRLPRENWLGPAVIFLGTCLLLTLTRQAWLGTIAGLIFLLWVYRRIWLWSLPAVLVLILVAAPAAVKNRVLSASDMQDETFLIRVRLWQAGWQIFKDHPLTGCGFKCVDTVYQNYPDHSEILSKYRGMHNNFLQVAVDTGLTGLAAWLAIWIGYFFSLYKHQGPAVGNSPRWVILGSVSAVIGFLVGGLFEVNFYDSEVAMLLYFLMALPFAARQTEAS